MKYTNPNKYATVTKINLLRLSDAYMRRQPRTSLVQIIAYRLFGTKQLSEKNAGEGIWKCRLGNSGQFVSASM